MSDEMTSNDQFEDRIDTMLEESASTTIWFYCKWFLYLMIPAALLVTPLLLMVRPEGASEVPAWFVAVFVAVVFAGIGCVFTLPMIAHMTICRIIMARRHPGSGWGKKAGLSGVVIVTMILWMGAVLTPFVYRTDITLTNFALATLIGVGICFAVMMVEIVFGMIGLIVISTIGKRLAKRSRKDDTAER